MDEFLVTQRGVEAEGFFMAPSGDTLRACAVVDDAIAAWALCLYVRGYLRDANKAWLQSSCEDRGLIFSMLKLDVLPADCPSAPDCGGSSRRLLATARQGLA